MGQYNPIDCRIAACAETGCRAGEWSFYLINDGASCIDQAVLLRCGHNQGDLDDTHAPNLRLCNIPPGGHVLLWRDEDHDVKLWLELRVRVGYWMQDLLFEFQQLCRNSEPLRPVAGLGQPGWISHPRFEPTLQGAA